MAPVNVLMVGTGEYTTGWTGLIPHIAALIVTDDYR